jgi:ribosome biogenesis protein Tsr3
MATATGRRKPAAGKIAKDQRALAEELLGIHRKLKGDFARMDLLEIDLKLLATDAKASLVETLSKLGKVTVAPGHGEEFKGDVPVIQTEAWNALTPAERKKLEKSGLVKIEPQWGRASSGRVTVKVL